MTLCWSFVDLTVLSWAVPTVLKVGHSLALRHLA